MSTTLSRRFVYPPCKQGPLFPPKNLCKPRYKVYLCSMQSSTEACGYKNKDFGCITEIYGYKNEDCGSRKKP